MEAVLFSLIDYTVLFVESLALILIVIGVTKSVFALFVNSKKSPGIYIGESLDLGLRYLMVAEVLHTFTTDSIQSLISLAILLGIRIVIVFVNQKELEHELAESEQLKANSQ